MMTQELMNKPRIKYSFYLGLLLVAFGILFNKWLIELFLVPYFQPRNMFNLSSKCPLNCNEKGIGKINRLVIYVKNGSEKG